MERLPCSWIKVLDKTEVAIHPKLIYLGSTNPYQSQVGFFAEIVNLILKFTYIFKELRITQTILKNKVED